jgi:hypothetical protein
MKAISSGKSLLSVSTTFLLQLGRDLSGPFASKKALIA